eukprot:ctg_3534.g596
MRSGSRAAMRRSDSRRSGVHARRASRPPSRTQCLCCRRRRRRRRRRPGQLGVLRRVVGGATFRGAVSGGDPASAGRPAGAADERVSHVADDGGAETETVGPSGRSGFGSPRTAGGAESDAVPGGLTAAGRSVAPGVQQLEECVGYGSTAVHSSGRQLGVSDDLVGAGHGHQRGAHARSDTQQSAGHVHRQAAASRGGAVSGVSVGADKGPSAAHRPRLVGYHLLGRGHAHIARQPVQRVCAGAGVEERGEGSVGAGVMYSGAGGMFRGGGRTTGKAAAGFKSPPTDRTEIPVKSERVSGYGHTSQQVTRQLVSVDDALLLCTGRSSRGDPAGHPRWLERRLGSAAVFNTSPSHVGAMSALSSVRHGGTMDVERGMATESLPVSRSSQSGRRARLGARRGLGWSRPSRCSPGAC